MLNAQAALAADLGMNHNRAVCVLEVVCCIICSKADVARRCWGCQWKPANISKYIAAIVVKQSSYLVDGKLVFSA
jgi:hypothetical protein